MSKITLAPDVSGSGTFTIAAPNSSTDRTLTLPDNSGTVQTQLDHGFGFRNRLINSDMRIDQRNNGASVGTGTGNGVYSVDRWQLIYDQVNKFTAQQNSGGVTPPSGFTNYLGAVSSSAYTVGSSETFNIRQYIEGFNAADLGWGTASAQSVTLSFWVRSSLTGTFGGAVSGYANTNSYPFTFAISAANTWEQKTITIPGATTGTWNTGNSGGVGVIFSLGTGSTLSGTAGVWSSSRFWSATGATSVVGTNGATFYITGVQLEAGSVATPFERRPYGQELALCQRYFETQAAVEVLVSWPNGPTCTSGTYVTGYISFAVTKRATPTITETSVSVNPSPWVNSAPSGVTVRGYTPQIYTPSNTNAYGNKNAAWSASAEL